MTINGWDISNADARQWNVTPDFQSVKNESEWIKGSAIPLFFKNKLGFKTVKIVLVVKKDGRQAVLNRCSEILSRLTEPAELELDGFEHAFYGILSRFSHDEKSMKRWHTLSLEFDCYEYAKNEIIYNLTGSSNTVNNPGNVLTPAVVEVTPKVGAAVIKISGICRDISGTDIPVTIRELVSGKKVILDGTTGLFTQSGELKAKDIDIWGLPTLVPGNNNITVDNSWMNICVRFRPHYM